MDHPIIDTRSVLLRAFPGIPRSQADDLVSACEQRTYPEGTILCHEGAQESTFYILLDGEVRVTKWFDASEERQLKFLHPGDFFGEMAIVNNAPRAATVATTCSTTVLEIRKEAFASLLEQSSSISIALMREVSRRLRENDEMAIEDLRIKARQLSEAYQQLSDLDLARREFLTTIAHELRTPLMAANGFLQVIRLGMLQGDALNSAVETVYHNLQQIITLTNDILFLQEMDLILPEFKPIDIGGVVASAVEQQRSRAEKNKVGIQLTIPPTLPQIAADARSLSRAINAILDNAIKFSPDGGDVGVEVGYDTATIWVKVQDHGVGIPESAMPRIFDRFYHLEQVEKHLFRGIGLGLSIARQVIEQHHGEIRAESRLGEGSLFTILLRR
jgi:signal transduction histidine kinase